MQASTPTDLELLRTLILTETGALDMATCDTNPTIPSKFVTVFLKTEQPLGFGSSSTRKIVPEEMKIADLYIPPPPRARGPEFGCTLDPKKEHLQCQSKYYRCLGESHGALARQIEEAMNVVFPEDDLNLRGSLRQTKKQEMEPQNPYFKEKDVNTKVAGLAQRPSMGQQGSKDGSLCLPRHIRNMVTVAEVKKELKKFQNARQSEQNAQARSVLQENAKKVLEIQKAKTQNK
jgi:hypothetical protein